MYPFPVIEEFSLVAPLGLCFHDAATGERVIDGLSVATFPAGQPTPEKKSVALPNRSGVYVFQKIPGLEEFSRGAGDAEFWAANPAEKDFVVEVVDRENRFQPFRLSLKLPVRGIYRWENHPAASPNRSLASVPLYSSPARAAVSGMAVVRAELRESPDKPASFAVLEARSDGKLLARGIADRRGRLVLMFPALAPANNPLASPPNAARITLAEQNWNLELALKYEPEIFRSSPPANEDDAENAPDLRLALAQKNGTLWADAEKTENLSTAVLRFGRELVLRSRASQNASPPLAETAFSSYLFVSPA